MQSVNALYAEHFGNDITEPLNKDVVDDTNAVEFDSLENDQEPFTQDSRIAEYCRDNASSDSEVNESSEEDFNVGTSENKCGCGDKNCLSQFKSSEIAEHILNIQEMDKVEKEMLIMGSLQRHTNEQVKGGKRKRVKVSYMFQGRRICKRAYRHIYDVGERTLKNLLKHMRVNGIVPRIHGNMGKKGHHSQHSYEAVKNAVTFLEQYAHLHGIPMPAAPNRSNNAPPVYLSSKETKKNIHATYKEACQTSGHKPLGLTVFQDTWRHCVPHIKIASPREDVCATCERMRSRIVKATSENEKLDASTEFTAHVHVCQNKIFTIIFFINKHYTIMYM